MVKSEKKKTPLSNITDNDYLKNQRKQVDDFNELLSKMNAKEGMNGTTDQCDNGGIL
jgi:hypothetical protein